MVRKVELSMTGGGGRVSFVWRKNLISIKGGAEEEGSWFTDHLRR